MFRISLKKAVIPLGICLVVSGCMATDEFGSDPMDGIAKEIDREKARQVNANTFRSFKRVTKLSSVDTQETGNHKMSASKSNPPGSRKVDQVRLTNGEEVTNSEEGSESTFPTIRFADGETQIAEKNNTATPIQTDEPTSYDIDLPTALRLAGSDNWTVRLAAERIEEAQARLLSAEALFLPNLSAGVGLNKHFGQIQATEGQVLNVNRGSAFVGGGGSVGNGALTGGSGGPFRLVADLSITDAIFKPLAAKQRVNAQLYRQDSTFNDVLLQASLAYFDLLKAQQLLALEKDIPNSNLKLSQELLNLTKAFQEAGKGSLADVIRADAELTNRQQNVVSAELAVELASARLAQILQLDPDKLKPGTLLHSTEPAAAAVEFIGETIPVSQLIAQATEERPEISDSLFQVDALCQEYQAEKWRPWIPNIHAGISAGGFGGGVNDNIQNFSDRSDFDLLAVWQLENLGVGNRSRRQETGSKHQQAILKHYRLVDRVQREVTEAWHEVRANRQAMDLAQKKLKQSLESHRRHIERIRALEGLPLEALQAVRAVAQAREDRLQAVISHNQAQLKLLRSIGRTASEE